MQTFKTAIVVVLLLVVLYGAYQVLNRPTDVEPPDEIAWLEDQGLEAPKVEFQDEQSTPIFPGGDSHNHQLPELPSDDSPVNPALSALPAAGPTGQQDARADSSAHAAPTAPRTDSGSFPQPPTVVPGAGETYAADSTFPTAPAEPDSAYQRSPAKSDSSVYNPRGMRQNPYSKSEAQAAETASADAARQLGSQGFERAARSAKNLMDEGRHREALQTLTAFYKSPDLSEQQHRQLLDLLDPLAGMVIYSTRHLVGEPYVVGRTETLRDIADEYHVPWQLLQNINGIRDPEVLLPGSELKVVPGPFRAEVDAQGRELTLFLGNLYAGRFPITIGSDPQPVAGQYKVRDKQTLRNYFSRDGRTIPGDSPNNPYGEVWLDLGRQICIHGTPRNGVPEQMGCISLSPRDASDVFGILSVGSAVKIMR